MMNSTTEISVQKPSDSQLRSLGVVNWSIWEKEVSEFPWSYDTQEVCYFLTGEVIVTPQGGEPVKMGKGELVTFPKGMSCTWQILSPVKKHYSFE